MKTPTWTRRAIRWASGAVIASSAVLIPVSTASAAPQSSGQVKESAPSTVCYWAYAEDIYGNWAYAETCE
ncbi:hypothetical protein STSP_15740 [Streptomyces jeddahensis]|uniref:Uncharacterized protein n=1 Tax=Streptomyces jeddahensis TaxID=1716141 RepID=A0A177HVJ7_9ACTN|nr:hypothetical protein STSP_15740 [Streptomyces jeddahensis]